MRKIKWYFLAVAFIAITSAFAVRETKTTTQYWVTGDPDVDGFYTIAPGPVSGCGSGSIDCKIQSRATPDGGKITSAGAQVLNERN